MAGLPLYVLGSPSQPSLKILREGGSSLTIIANNWSVDNVYVTSVTLNGKAMQGAFVSHAELDGDAVLVFDMCREESDWGKNFDFASVYPSIWKLWQD